MHQANLLCMPHRLVTSSCHRHVDVSTKERSLLPHCRRGTARLPTDLKLLRSTDSFLRQLKTFLFESVYEHWEIRIIVHSIRRWTATNCKPKLMYDKKLLSKLILDRLLS